MIFKTFKGFIKLNVYVCFEQCDDSYNTLWCQTADLASLHLNVMLLALQMLEFTYFVTLTNCSHQMMLKHIYIMYIVIYSVIRG